MTNDLRKVESRIYLKYFGDGLWDIWIGLNIMLFGVGMMSDMPYLAGITVPLAYVVISQAKAKITYPRIGYIKFKQTQKRLVRSLLAGVLLVGLIFFSGFFLRRDSELVTWLRQNFGVMIGLVFGGALSLISLIVQSPRFYAYGITVFVFASGSKWLGSLEVNFTLAGVVIFLTGFYVLFRFIRTYPLNSSEEE